MHEKIICCLPTYNEAENIAAIVNAILRFVPQSSILIIDDHSPDGTGQIADTLSHQDSRISVLHRPQKEGLGKAYCHGFQVALDRMKADIIVQMDADLSHPPEKLPEMIDAIQMNDLVIGSRYIPGGGTKNWNMARRMISRFGAIYARVWLGLPVNDPTGGFKVWRSDLLKHVLACPVRSEGYGFQVETTFIARCLGARIVEIPICFSDRHVGRSKMTAGIAFEAFWQIPFMRVRCRYLKKKSGCYE
ncbi:MAG: polyprenol monophosphomannose synthase [Desulfobacteraceae bacterium]|jgi:dolichol-phosphate mannosyltransferase|nr:polyprenol monophosphomannose synthase [Desulfobacteraceae bacterium]